jgi:hypothetical protein
MAKNLQIEIDLPEKLPSGKYIITGNFANSVYGHIGCINVELNVN